MTSYRLRVTIVPNGTTYLRLLKQDAEVLKLENGDIVQIEGLQILEK